MNGMYVLIAFVTVIISAGITMALVPVIRRLAVRWNLMDRPRGRKDHRAPVPLGGGVAFFLTIAAMSVRLIKKSA